MTREKDWIKMMSQYTPDWPLQPRGLAGFEVPFASTSTSGVSSPPSAQTASLEAPELPQPRKCDILGLSN